MMPVETWLFLLLVEHEEKLACCEDEEAMFVNLPSIDIPKLDLFPPMV